MTLSYISLILSTAACICWAYVIHLKHGRLKNQSETIRVQQLIIDALRRQLDARDRIIQQQFEEETLRRK